MTLQSDRGDISTRLKKDISTWQVWHFNMTDVTFQHDTWHFNVTDDISTWQVIFQRDQYCVHVLLSHIASDCLAPTRLGCRVSQSWLQGRAWGRDHSNYRYSLSARANACRVSVARYTTFVCKLVEVQWLDTQLLCESLGDGQWLDIQLLCVILVNLQCIDTQLL